MAMCFDLLSRRFSSLSTGEIRKVLIIRALAQRPRLLILDNAFDGLDVETRDNLKDLVSRTIQGFRPDILVQGVSAKATAHTQVLLITNRQEEIVDEIEHVTFLTKEGLVTEDRRSGQKLLEQALASTVAFNSEDSDDTSLPTLKEIRALWKSDTSSSVSDMKILAKGLNYVKGDNALIKELHWKVTKGQRWLIAGRNGAGKSSLSRLLAKSEPDNASLAGQLWLDNVECREDRRRRGVGWCSTELHLELTLGESARTVQDVFQDEGSTPQSMYTVLAWLGLDGRSIESLPYLELSQGQQKLILIGAAIACQPDTLVFDEITQGLDVFNRRRVLNLLQLVCEATDVTLIYITHHLEELELLPSITKVLHLAGGEAIFNGELDEYSADAV
jgi:molybdate transport system ATP-binding protein